MNKIKTVIAAGGLGTRLQGFRGNDSTKILLQVDGLPMIVRQINQLLSWGMSEFIIITNPSFDNMIKDVMIQYFPEKNIKYKIMIPVNTPLFAGKEKKYLQTYRYIYF